MLSISLPRRSSGSTSPSAVIVMKAQSHPQKSTRHFKSRSLGRSRTCAPKKAGLKSSITYRQPSKRLNRSKTLSFRITKTSAAATTINPLAVSGLDRFLEDCIAQPQTLPSGMPTEKPVLVRSTGKVHHAPRSGAQRAAQGSGISGGQGGGNDGDAGEDRRPGDSGSRGGGGKGPPHEEDGTIPKNAEPPIDFKELLEDMLFAIDRNKEEKVAEILAKCAPELCCDLANNLLDRAAADHQIQIVNLFLEAHVPPDVSLTDLPGVTLLMIAARNMDFEMVERLIAAGADVSRRDNHGRTAVAYAAHAARCPGSAHGISPNIEDASSEVIELLVKAGSDKSDATNATGYYFCFPYPPSPNESETWYYIGEHLGASCQHRRCIDDGYHSLCECCRYYTDLCKFKGAEEITEEQDFDFEESYTPLADAADAGSKDFEHEVEDPILMDFGAEEQVVWEAADTLSLPTAGCMEEMDYVHDMMLFNLE